jgi:UDP-2,3-diacylglucosamine hydrolase
LAQKSSGYSRSTSGESDKKFLGEENEWLAVFAKEQLQTEHFDYFIFGHRHLPMQIRVGENSEYINIGDWLHHYTYGVMEDGVFELKKLNA